MANLISKDLVKAAAERIAGRVHRTPLFSSRSLSERCGVPIYFKAECFQKAGSFKARGAFNTALSLSDEERQRGLLTYSSGNHGQAVAYVASVLGVKAVIVMPEDAPESKKAACQEYGAAIELAGFTSDDRRSRAHEIRDARGLTIIEPFHDPRIIAGQGTLAMEILEDAPEPLTTIVAPIGGGGLISGTLAAVRPGRVQVIGVEPELACAMHRSLQAGKITSFEPGQTIADGLKPTRPGALNFQHALELGLETVLVNEEDIKAALRFLFERARLVAEPSGAAATAAILSGKFRPSGPTAIVISGGNVDAGRYGDILKSQC
jgi:threo-3-hydroxy-L-aspartate ammonia-lyase